MTAKIIGNIPKSKKILSEDTEERNYDYNSTSKIWIVEYEEIGLTGETYEDFKRSIESTMDEVIENYPELTYDDFAISTDVSYSYEDSFGVLKLEYEHLETDAEFESRMKRLKGNKESDAKRIQEAIARFKEMWDEPPF